MEPTQIDEEAAEKADRIYKHPAALILNAEDLRGLVEADPDWVSKNATAERPVIVTDHCDLARSKIRSLSPHILFQGLDEKGNSAGFDNCLDLKIAQGVFLGTADFGCSGVEEIDSGNLTILQPNNEGIAAFFGGCPDLKIARGRFPGWVDFSDGGVEKIDTHPKTGLVITGCNRGGQAAAFKRCERLQVAEGTFPGFVTFQNSGIHTIGKLVIDREKPFKAEFRGCEHLVHCPKEIFNDKAGYSIMPTARNRIAEQHEKEDRARRALKQPSIEM